MTSLVLLLVLVLALLILAVHSGEESESYALENEKYVQPWGFKRHAWVKLYSLSYNPEDSTWNVIAETNFYDKPRKKGGKLANIFYDKLNMGGASQSHQVWDASTGQPIKLPPTRANIVKIKKAARAMFLWRINAGGYGGRVLTAWKDQRAVFKELILKEQANRALDAAGM